MQRTFKTLLTFQVNRHFSNFGQKLNPIKKSKDVQNQSSKASLSDHDYIVQSRRQQDQYLRKKDKKENKAMSYFIQHYDSQTIQLELYMDHTCKECQYIDSLFNYYQVSYRRNQNISYLENFKYRYRTEFKEEVEWPILRVDISLEPSQFIKGRQEIEKFMINNGFILELTHLTNSAWSQQGIEFANEKVDDTLNTLFLSPILTSQLQLKTSPESLRSNQRSFQILDIMIKSIRRVGYHVIRNMFRKMKKRKEYKGSKDRLESEFKEWEERIGDKEYHGGQQPDEADFAMFAVIKCKTNSYSFMKFMEDKTSRRMYNWFIRMTVKTKYEPNRLMIQG